MGILIENPNKYRAALYARLSKEDETEGPSGSVTNQVSMLKGFAAEHQLVIYDTYVDDGWSGTNFDRPEFQRMISDIEAGKVNMVITKDLSRLGRDYITVGHYMERYFPEMRVRYISLLDGVDTGIESSSNDITPFRAIMNDMYAKDISQKIKSVKRDKQRKGQFIGGKPMFGYRMHPTQPNAIVIDEGAAPIVRRIFSMALEGMSCRKIAARLNEDGIPTPSSYANLRPGRTGPYTGLWSGERISEMLRNETYIGNMVQGRRRKVSYKSRKCISRAREDWVVVEQTHEPLIDSDTFRKVQLLLESRKHTRSRTYDFLLKGLIFCHECGYPLAVINRKNAAGEDVLYFVCRTYQRFTKAGVCASHTIKEQTVTQAVSETVRNICMSYLDPEQLQPAAQAAVERRQQHHRAAEELQQVQQKIDTLTSRLDKIYLDCLNELITEDDFRRFYGMMNNQRADLTARAELLKQQMESPVDTELQAKKLVEQFIESACTSREVLISLIERIELTQDKQMIIRFRFRELEQSDAMQEK